METVILIGLQGSGKSTFCRQRFYDTHVRINLDMLRTRNRERMLVEACITAKQAFVVDNTNPTVADREQYFGIAKTADFRITGYYFPISIDMCLARNDARPDGKRLPNLAILGTAKRLERPTPSEGFDAVLYVRPDNVGGFTIEEYHDEI
jgi:predicted kinase